MGLFGHGGLLSKIKRETVSRFNNFVKRDLGGWDNILKGAGLVAAGVLTGGLGAAAGAGTIAGLSATTAGGIAGATLAAGSVASGIEAEKLERQAEKENAAAQAEIDKANKLAETQRRAELFSLRKQIGKKNVGTKGAIFGASSSKSTTDYSQNGVVLG